LQKLPNGEIFQKAIREKRIVLTFDLDFGEVVAGSGGRSVSVILFRLRNTRADFLVQRLKSVLEQLEGFSVERAQRARSGCRDRHPQKPRSRAAARIGVVAA
jgi:predicted nuclease of predicted toxin-antitoxin system